MMCVGHHGIKPNVYGNFMEKNKCIRTNGRLKKGIMYLYLIS